MRGLTAKTTLFSRFSSGYRPALSGILAAVFAAGMTAAHARAETDSPSLEYQVKAAYLFNFTKFVEWPATAPDQIVDPDADPKLEICVPDPVPFRGALAKIDGQRVGDKVLSVISPDIAMPGAMERCSILFLDRRTNSVRDDLLKQVSGKPVLTIGDSSGFLAGGGIVELVRRRGRVLFRIDVEHARRAGLRVDPQLLGLALED